MIKFGTDGWRAVIADQFTFENVSIVTQALIDYLNDLPAPNRTVAVGYDRRFLSEQFAAQVAAQMAANNFQVLLFDAPVPTPMVSYQVKVAALAAGVVITASHNPPEFNGFKVKAAFGGSAPPEITQAIEARLYRSKPQIGTLIDAIAAGHIEPIQPSADYGRQVARLVDLDRIKSANVNLVVDPMHGSGNRWVEHLLAGGNCRVRTIRAERDAYFGGVNPEPLAQNLAPLAQAVHTDNALIGLATDGDADRVGALDEMGQFINSHQIVAVLLLHLARRRGWQGGVVRTFSQSVLIKRIAESLGLPLYETPIGFKYIAELMLTKDILIGGEESGGIGILGHIPERDGIVNSLLLAEAVIASESRPSQLLSSIWREFGRFYYNRLDLHANIARGKEFVERVRQSPPAQLGGEKVVDLATLDGTKLIFADESWLLLRQSGTEPVLRLYCEATSAEKMQTILAAAQDFAIAAGIQIC
ncbi:MAG: phosphoglucomutase/phosphomannomutase family protein [Acidobacteriota bacterium]